MAVNWDADPEDDQDRAEFERSAIEAARGWVQTMDELHDALGREAKLKAQLAALIGIEGGKRG